MEVSIISGRLSVWWCYASFILSLCASQPEPFPTTPTHDLACLVPPAPLDKAAGNKLFTLAVKSPWFPDPDVDRIRETLYFTHGECGLDVFVLEKGWIFDNLIPVGFSNYCRKLNYMSQTNLPQVNIIRAGSLTGGIAPTLMPLPRRLPLHWRSGIIIWIHYDRIVASDNPFHMVCNYPYNNILGGINVMLNVNATLSINGCPLRKFGANCDQSCDYCAKGVNCNSFTGACICPKGFYGATCSIAQQGVHVNQEFIYLPFGDTANLTCTSHGIRPRSGRWQKQGVQLNSRTGYKIVNYNPRPMVISTAITAHDTSVDGIYTCEVMDEIGEIYRKTVNVTVIGIPDAFVELPFDQEVTIGSPVSFRCSVKESTGRIRWFRGEHSYPNNATEIVSSRTHRIINHSPLTSELVIDEVTMDDEDVYKCFVGHVFSGRDLVSAQAKLTVFIPTRSSRIVGFREGDTLNIREQVPFGLECKADFTKPPPRVTWFIGDKVIVRGILTNTVLNKDGMTYNITSRMTLAPLWKHDKNAVRCVMENMAMGSVSTGVVLDVSYLPKVKTPAKIEVVVGDKLQIECKARANPTVREYKWSVEHPNDPGYHSLNPFEMNGQTTVDVLPNAEIVGNLYKLKKVDEKYNDMIVVCTAYNFIGSGMSETHIKVKPKPAAMSAPVVGIGIMVAVGMLVLIIVLQCFKRQIRSLCAVCEKGDEREDKEYDVFVCYKSGTEEEELYVVRILIPWLEERGFSVCVHYKHFSRNKGEDENITQAITHSSKIILVLSPAFINSSWYMYDFRPSLDELNTSRQGDVIPIMYEDMTLAHNMDPALYRLLRNVSYIQWPAHDPEGCGSRDLFWKLLRNSLPRIPLGERSKGIAASDVSLPEMVSRESMRYNAEEESLWPLPPRRERLFHSRRMSDNSRRTPRAREMVPPNVRRPRGHRPDAWRNPATARMQQRNYGLHDQGREDEYDTYDDPNRVLII